MIVVPNLAKIMQNFAQREHQNFKLLVQRWENHKIGPDSAQSKLFLP